MGLAEEPTVSVYVDLVGEDRQVYRRALPDDAYRESGLGTGRMPYEEYAERLYDARPVLARHGVELPTIYDIAEHAVMAEPHEALRSGLVDDYDARRIADTWTDRLDEADGPDEAMDMLRDLVDDRPLGDLLDVPWLRDRVTVEIGTAKIVPVTEE